MENRNEYVHTVYDALHQIPEPGYKEFKTSEFIESESKKMGYKIHRNVANSTGIIAVLDSNREGPFVGIRADMDALPYQMDDRIEYRHTCGHDAHSSIALAVAKSICSSGITMGKLYFIFQPAEELLTGAKTVISSGLLNDMTHIIGMHIRPYQECDFGQAAPALWHSALARLNIKLTGTTAHAGRAHLGANPIETAILIANAINTIKINPRVSSSINITRVNTGDNAENSLPEELNMCIDVRCADNTTMRTLLQELNLCVESCAKITHTKAACSVSSCPAAEYSSDMIDAASRAIEKVLGADGLVEEIHTVGAEDFHYYTKEIGCKAAYVALGANAKPGLHHKEMVFERKAMDYGVDIFLEIINTILN